MSSFLSPILHLQEITRNRFRDLLQATSSDLHTVIPKGMNNHMLWNYGHILVTFYLLTYGRSKASLPISDEVLSTFRKGSAPNNGKCPFSLEELINIDLQTSLTIQADMDNGVLQSYEPYTTSYGVELNSLEEALRFNLIHESLHLGYAMAQRRALTR